MKTDSSARMLGADGPFADVLEGFAPRDEQVRMADAVQEAFEAGT